MNGNSPENDNCAATLEDMLHNIRVGMKKANLAVSDNPQVGEDLASHRIHLAIQKDIKRGARTAFVGAALYRHNPFEGQARKKGPTVVIGASPATEKWLKSLGIRGRNVHYQRRMKP